MKKVERIRKSEVRFFNIGGRTINTKNKLLLIFTIITILGIIFATIDYFRAVNNKNPLFAIRTAVYKDGGSKNYFGFGYKIIACNTLSGNNSVYFGFYNLDVNKLCNDNSSLKKFKATIINIEENTLIVEPFENEEIRNSSDRISIKIKSNTNYEVGRELLITYTGEVLESYPAQINTIDIKEIKN